MKWNRSPLCKWKKLTETTWNKHNINWTKEYNEKEKRNLKKDQQVSKFYQKRYKIAMALAGHHRLAKNKLCKYVKRFELPDSRLTSLVNSLQLFLAGNVDLEIFENFVFMAFSQIALTSVTGKKPQKVDINSWNHRFGLSCDSM